MAEKNHTTEPGDGAKSPSLIANNLILAIWRFIGELDGDFIKLSNQAIMFHTEFS